MFVIEKMLTFSLFEQFELWLHVFLYHFTQRYSKVSNKRGTTAIYFWKKSTHCVLIRYAYFTKFKKIPSKCSDFLSGNTNSFEISVYLLHFTLLRLFIAWDLSRTTLIRCTTVIRYFRVRWRDITVAMKLKRTLNSCYLARHWHTCTWFKMLEVEDTYMF